MHNNKNTFFQFDYLMLVDGNKKSILGKKKFILKSINKSFLGIILNHRMFSLKEKNLIKNELEFLNLHSMMFSLRPSTKNKLINKLGNKINFYKNFLQLYYCFFMCQKYNINKLVISESLKKKLKIDNNLSKSFKYNLEKIKKCFNKPEKGLIFFNLLNIKDFDFTKIKIFYIQNTKELTIIDKTVIARKDKDLFWLGFDDNYQEVPYNQKYKKDFWESKKNRTNFGDPLFKNLKYCSRCCLPETSEGIEFDDYGICTICRTSEEKMNINWSSREKKLRNIFNKFRSNKNYDCLLPISGGKDSTFQSYVLKNVYSLNPLCVTHGQNWLSKKGRFNLENCLLKFDLDHLIFIPSREIINKVAKKSVSQIGDACWHCHIGVGSISYQTSVIWKINLVVFGEAPADTDARGQHKIIKEVSPFRVIKESAIKDTKKFVDNNISKKELSHWAFPTKKEFTQNKTKVIHLGQYIFWDEQKNIDFVSKKFGWQSGPVENTYKTYKSVECVMAGVHDYFNFIKRGIGRATVHSSEDVRRGLITRQEGFELAKENDIRKPHALKYYQKITGLGEKDILNSLRKSRSISKYASKIKY